MLWDIHKWLSWIFTEACFVAHISVTMLGTFPQRQMAPWQSSDVGVVPREEPTRRQHLWHSQLMGTQLLGPNHDVLFTMRYHFSQKCLNKQNTYFCLKRKKEKLLTNLRQSGSWFSQVKEKSFVFIFDNWSHFSKERMN